MSNKLSLRKDQVELIEQLAFVHESLGIQPAMGKILALLTVSDEVELTFDQIRDTLDLSKSAISQALNQLLLTKRISYKTKIGDRKRYFHTRVSEWETHINDQFSGLAALVEVMRKVLAKRPAKTKEFNQHLKNMTDFLAFLHDQLPGMYRKFRQEKK